MSDTTGSADTTDTHGAAGIRDRITELVDDEHRLRSHPEPTDEDRAKLRAIENELDQCWDLLRQRRALTDTGHDPAEAKPRPVPEVEGYLQ